MGLVAQGHVESSWSRDWTCVCCIGKWILNHWLTREVHGCFFFVHSARDALSSLWDPPLTPWPLLQNIPLRDWSKKPSLTPYPQVWLKLSLSYQWLAHVVSPPSQRLCLIIFVTLELRTTRSKTDQSREMLTYGWKWKDNRYITIGYTPCSFSWVGNGSALTHSTVLFD